MAQFNFYCVARNYPQIIDAVCDNADWGVMPCWHPAKPVPVYHRYCADLGQAIITNKRLYVVGPFSVEGIKVEKVAESNFSISMEKCGPLISLTLGGSREDNGLEHVWGGDVWYRPWYETKEGTLIKPNIELKAAYADIVKRIKQICRRIRVQKWIYATEEVCKLIDHNRGVVKEWTESGLECLLINPDWEIAVTCFAELRECDTQPTASCSTWTGGVESGEARAEHSFCRDE